ncbi:MAG TPA: hypothetical protein PK095_16810, partial [Myxococcota bacterium]|nr:hypothetical protein [Myxococcota bacterium]
EPETAGPDALDRAIGAVASPLDRMRQLVWGLTAKTAWGRACVRDRGLRLASLAVGHMLVAFLLALFLPLWLLLLGPLILGAPHVVSDVRYLLLKPPVPLMRRGLYLILAPLVAMTVCRVIGSAGGPFSVELEVMLGGLAMVFGVVCARGALWWRLLVGLGVVLLTGVALMSAYTSLVVIAHAHNLVAFGLWLFFLKGEVPGRALGVVIAVYVTLSAILLSPLTEGLMLDHATGNIGAFNLVNMADALAPGLSLEVGLRWVLLFGFLQSMHYAIWLRLIPQRLDARKAPPTFRRSLKRLREDFGGRAFVLIALVCLMVPVFALSTDAEATRHVYLLAAVSHGYIELAIIAALLASRARKAEGRP